MKAAEEQALWQRLCAANLVAGELPSVAEDAAPWFVRVMQGVGGWISALFLLLFVGAGLEFVFRSTAMAYVFGVGACLVAWVIFRSQSKNEYLAQFGLAISLAGQGLVWFAIGDDFHTKADTVALGMCVFQTILFFAMPNFVHRVWAAWTGAGAGVFALTDWGLQAYAPGLLSLSCAWVWVWLNEFRMAQRGALLRPGGYGLVLALMCAVTVVTLTSHAGPFFGHRSPAHAYHIWIGACMSGAALLWAVHGLLLREGAQPAARARLLAAAAILALATLKAPGLAPATLILLLGYGNGSRVLFGLGVASLLGYLSFYYYSLEITLLQKSELLAATGTALLAARYLLRRQWAASSPEEGGHA